MPDKLFKAADKSPRGEKTLMGLAGAVDHLAEAVAFTECLGEGFPFRRRVAGYEGPCCLRWYRGKYRRIPGDRGFSLPRGHKRTGQVVAGIRLARARSAILAGTAPMPRLDRSDITRLLAECGDREILMHLSNFPERREEYTEKHWYHPLSEDEASALRDGAADVLRKFNDAFNKGEVAAAAL